jgi:hypothetical protein
MHLAERLRPHPTGPEARKSEIAKVEYHDTSFN